MANWLLFASSVTLVESLFYLGFGTYSILEYFCILDWLMWTKTTVITRVLYYHNPTCGESVNLGYHVDDLPNQAMITMTSIPLTTVKFMSLNVGYMVIHTVWFFASLALIRKSRSYKYNGKKKSRCVWLCWISVTGVALLTDIVASSLFFADAFQTDTIANLSSYIGATISGFSGRGVDGTWIPSIIMGAVFGRGLIGWILHLVAFIYVFSHPPWSRNDDEDKLVEAPKEPETTPPPQMTAREVQTQPPSDRPHRRSTPLQDYDRVDREPIQPVRAARTGVIEEVDESRRINYPVSLLSIPQQLEQVLADSNRKWQHAATSLGPATVTVERERDRRHSVASSHTQTTADLIGGGATTAAPNLKSNPSATGGQKAWSYYHFGSSSHRMRDQLPPDEELPPVPVPDYTLRPSKGIISLLRGGSSASASTTNTLPPAAGAAASTSTPNWRANDVLY